MMITLFGNRKKLIRGIGEKKSGHPPGLLLLPVVFALVGCATDGPRSFLDPAGPAAEQIASLWWKMFWVYGLVFVVTMALLILALSARRREGSPLGNRFVFTAGVAIPALILIVMLVITLQVMGNLRPTGEDLRVKVTSHHWWFEVEYPGHGVLDANEIHVPVGSQVRFDLHSAGIVHSFWVPKLGGKRDMLPDYYNELYLQADKPGVYHGTCTEYCAGVHALMGFRLVAHEPQDFAGWLEDAAEPPPDPAEPGLQRGREVFMSSGCAGCHTIKGVSGGTIGPDLTLIGARHTLGAGTMENSRGNLAGWIANSQAIKPGNKMPRSYIEANDLHALVDYLWSLK